MSLPILIDTTALYSGKLHQKVFLPIFIFLHDLNTILTQLCWLIFWRFLFSDFSDFYQNGCAPQEVFDRDGQDILGKNKSATCEKFASKLECVCKDNLCNSNELVKNWVEDSTQWK